MPVSVFQRLVPTAANSSSQTGQPVHPGVYGALPIGAATVMPEDAANSASRAQAGHASLLEGVSRRIQRMNRCRAAIEEDVASAHGTAEEGAALASAREALTDVLRLADMEKARVEDIVQELDAAKRPVLAGWRASQRQIDLTEARALYDTLAGMMAEIRRVQVDLSGRLLDLG